MLSKYVKLFIPTALFFLLVDFIWLNYIARDFYLSRMQGLVTLTDGVLQVNLFAAITAYLTLVVGIIVFVLPRARTYLGACLFGATFGFVTYGTYNFTCHAIMNNWTLPLTMVDLLWGMFICSTTSLVASIISRRFSLL